MNNNIESKKKVFIGRLEQLINDLKEAEPEIQTNVGQGLKMAGQLFGNLFPSTEDFQNLSSTEQKKFIKSLSIIADELSSENPDASIGFSVFQMWLGLVVANDAILIQKYSKELELLSNWA